MSNAQEHGQSHSGVLCSDFPSEIAGNEADFMVDPLALGMYSICQVDADTSKRSQRGKRAREKHDIARSFSGLSKSHHVECNTAYQLAGIMSEHFGYRWTLITALLALIGFIFIPLFARTLAVFLIGE